MDCLGLWLCFVLHNHPTQSLLPRRISLIHVCSTRVNVSRLRLCQGALWEKTDIPLQTLVVCLASGVCVCLTSSHPHLYFSSGSGGQKKKMGGTWRCICLTSASTFAWIGLQGVHFVDLQLCLITELIVSNTFRIQKKSMKKSHPLAYL